MTDEELICQWMEPKPSQPDELTLAIGCGWRSTPGGWWVQSPLEGPILPCGLRLDALWEVEERLTDEQWSEYGAIMLGYPEGAMIRDRPHVEEKRLLHATAEQKIAALAAVLRSSCASGEQPRTQMCPSQDFST